MKIAPEIFKEEEWRKIEDLIYHLDEKQSVWLSGYLAGRTKTPCPQQPDLQELMICHGGETGNSKKISSLVEQQALKLGYRAKIVDLGQIKFRQFSKFNLVVLICSTHGDGDPPEPVLPFYTALMSDSGLRLEAMNYAVLALGDSSYEHFCATGIAIDKRLNALGAARLLERQDCDVDYQRAADHWIQKLALKLPRIKESHNTDTLGPPTPEADRSNPMTVKVIENIQLSAEWREDAVHHLVCDLEENPLALAAGDAIGVLVKNPIDLVTRLLEITNLQPQQMVNLGGVAVPLLDALTDKLDITIPSRDFGQLWESLDTSGLFHAAMGDSEKERKEFLKNQPLIELITKFRAPVKAQQLVDVLRPLQPRLYDIANSLRVTPDEVHLCIKRYSYIQGNAAYKGIGSNYIVDLKPGAALQIFPHKHLRFHLPESHEVPLILIADSTGVAPFRSFIQEMEAENRAHPCWLIFSEQLFEEDFLYQSEWINAMSSGTLKALNPVFYQDTPRHTLFSAILEQEGQFRDWLEQGAHIYLSGDKTILAKTEEAIKEWTELQEDIQWTALSANKRLHKNLY
ncbi:flavodoxin domain-containing protein [Methylobacillus caricis]|uniref:diflavin oxidoreductase n=1 Tax=Methylobacillus caricis TaxID=1971611 RepID=UPI001CFFBD1D|nr:flavodoxin domain-containing protein [Methylobacillus caricis]MCB5186646.1 flavodoxin domain-containing protein [Methylobacillus caricis]